MAKQVRRTGKTHWLTPFMKFREDLQSLAEGGFRLHHDVFLASRDRSQDVDVLQSLDAYYEYGKRPTQVVVCRVSPSVWAHHCFFSQVGGDFQVFAGKLRDLHRWLQDVPAGFLPAQRRIAVPAHTWGNAIKWIALLYYLAWKYGDEILGAETYYADSETGLEYEPWVGCSAYPNWDVESLITGAPQQDRTKKLWKPEGWEDGPDLIEGYLTTDVVKASMRAVLLLKYYGLDPVPHVDGGHSSSPREREPDDRDGRAAASRLKIHSALCEHHGCESKKVNDAPLTAVQIAKRSGVSQSTVSRQMPRILGGMDAYRWLCEARKIKAYLEGSNILRIRAGLAGEAVKDFVDKKAKTPLEHLLDKEIDEGNS